MLQWKDEDSTSNFQYVRLADEIERKTLDGTYRAGEKLPSVRRLHRQLGLSISTILQSYIELEKRGIIESKPRSGYFVKVAIQDILPTPKLKKHRSGVPKKSSTYKLIDEVIRSIFDQSLLPLGAAVLSTKLLPVKQFSRTLKTVASKNMDDLMRYGNTVGLPELRRMLSKRILGVSGEIDQDEIIITNGCLEGINLCLRSIAKPGDTIAVESPTYSGFLQMIEDAGMLALEIPTDPSTGVDLDYLEKVVKEKKIQGGIFHPNFHMPLGFVMPDPNKKRLVEMFAQSDLPLIEDGVLIDMYFGEIRPTSLKSFDKKGLVLYCSSFSKTLAPGFRVGWTVPGKYKSTVQRLKLNLSLASPNVTQLVITEFLKSGFYDRHLRKVRAEVKKQMRNTVLAIARNFPPDTKVTAPQGGYVLWVQLPQKVNSTDIYCAAKNEGIMIVPGNAHSCTNQFRNYIRISCANPWNDELDRAFVTLGRIIKEHLNAS